ncbi:MAG: hypothetical protein JNM17_02735 [Archangium sp.]|nr:hypothetical protein [Archangium sp.]
MSFAPDILDLMGKTPREFAGLHVHFESVQRVDRGRVVASVLVQAAFHPIANGALVVFFAGTKEITRTELPTPRALEVLRLRVPMKLDAELEQLGALILAPPLASGAERIRPAWKLHDTLEIPKLSEMEPIRETSLSFDPTATALSTLISGGLSIEFNLRSVEVEQDVRTKTHKARELPAHLTCAIEGTTKPISEILTETVWREGDPLPEPPPVVRRAVTAVAPSAIKRCGACAWEGPAAELERRTTCPACDALWG